MAIILASGRGDDPARTTAPMGGRVGISDTAQTETRTRIHVAALQSARGLLPEARINQIVDDVWGGMTPQERLTAHANPGAWMARVESEVRQAQGTKPLNASAATPAELAAHRASMGLAGQFAGAGMRGMRASDAGASGASGGDRYADLREAGARSGVSAALIADYTRQYHGMGFGKDSIATFAAVQLGAHEFRELQQRGLKSGEIVRAARDLKDMGMTGKDNVEHAHHADPTVKGHLKRANKACAKGDKAGCEAEVEKAEQANEGVQDGNRKRHGSGLIEGYRQQKGLAPSNAVSRPQSAPDPKADAGAKKIFEELKAKKAAPKP